jgi:hypothetical protein
MKSEPLTAQAARDRLLGMTLPRILRRGERVRVDGHDGTFIVVRVDKIDSFASVERWDDPGQILRGVSFDAIRRIRQDFSEAA